MHPLLLAALQSPRLRRWIVVAVVTVVALVAGFLLMVLVAVSAGANAEQPTSGDAGSCTSGATGDSGLSEEQAGNAAAIIDAGKQLGVPAYGWVVALATALAESGLRNLDYGDRDSLGLFQQRPSQGWGTPAQVTDPTYAATSFYRRLVAVPGWEELPVTVAAQTVQRSAFPNIYARYEAQARSIVGGTCTAAPAGPPGSFIWPAAGPVTSEFGPRWGRLHAGLDIGAPIGTPIHASAAGTVTHVGPMGGYGNTVVVDHGNGTTTLYAHQSRTAAGHGQPVEQGQLIGYVGNTGNSTGPHLHFEIRVDGKPINPRQRLGAR